MDKNKLTTSIFIVIVFFLGLNFFIKINEQFDGATLSGSIGGITFHNNEKFSKEDKESLTKICFAKQKNRIDINSETAKNLGRPTNTMKLSIDNKIESISTKSFDYNLWFGNNKGYIKNENDNKIYELSNEENEFFINAYLKFHSTEEVKNMISKEF